MGWWSELLMKYGKRDRMQVAPGLRIGEERGPDVAAILREARQACDLKQEEVEARTGIKQTTISSWETGRFRPTVEGVEKLARLYGVPLGRFLGLEEEALSARPDLLSVPIVGRVSAGTGNRPGEEVVLRSLAGGSLGETLEISSGRIQRVLRARNHEVAALEVDGSSMEPAYEDGDLIVVERLSERGMLVHRDHVIVDLDGSGRHVLRVWLEKLRLLMPLNVEKFQEVVATKETVLWGRVVALVRVR